MNKRCKSSLTGYLVDDFAIPILALIGGLFVMSRGIDLVVALCRQLLGN